MGQLVNNPLGALTSAPSAYNVDDKEPGIILQMYLNDQLDDCVMAARAHHTIRLAYMPGAPILHISDDEVSTEYFLETGNFNSGLVLVDSLASWKSPGWAAGGVSGRTIEDFCGPLSVDGSGMRSGDATTDLNPDQLKNCIIAHCGVQADMSLPDGIAVDAPASYGAGVLWQDTSRPQSNRHVMLLTGYTERGPIGITWGASQAMTWEFFEAYCLGVYWIQQNHST